MAVTRARKNNPAVTRHWWLERAVADKWLCRPHWRPLIQPLLPSEHELLVQLGAGVTLQNLQAFADAQDIAMDHWLPWLLRYRCLAGFQVTPS